MIIPAPSSILTRRVPFLIIGTLSSALAFGARPPEGKLHLTKLADTQAITSGAGPTQRVDSNTTTAAPSASPYPVSPVFAGLELDWSTHRRAAPGSDNFQLTWADDDHLYGAWGDGGGFGGDNQRGRVGLGVARIEGPPRDFRGFNVWGGMNAAHRATFAGKSWGMLALGSDLYMWVVPDGIPGKGYRNHYAYIELARSTNHGATWNRAPWRFLESENLTIPTFLNFGRAYRDVPEKFAGYVYAYFIRPERPDLEHEGPAAAGLIVHRPGELFLARAPVAAFPPGKADFEFFTGLDANHQPRWGALEAKSPVFSDAHGVGWCLSASYHPGLGRVLLATEHGVSHAGRLGIFDAPAPWGPWTTVSYHSADAPFGHERPGSELAWANNVFFVALPTKWFDGDRFALTFTGSGRGKDNDSFNVVEGRWLLRNP